MHLLDINVWLGMTFSLQKHHAAASAWFASTAGQACCFCRLTQLGFLRLATNAKVNSYQTLTMPQAWQAYDRLRSDPRILYLPEPEGVEPLLRQDTQLQSFSQNVWSDAYLAAFARVAGLHVVTFDQGFTQYAGLSRTILK